MILFQKKAANRNIIFIEQIVQNDMAAQRPGLECIACDPTY